jgi:pyruvate,water dikinase
MSITEIKPDSLTTSNQFIKGFEQLDKAMFEECGGKAANLGELSKLHLNVPYGFSVLGDSFYHHLTANGIRNKIDAIAATLDVENYLDLENKTAAIRKLIEEAPVPVQIERAITESYLHLSEDPAPFVAVRSSVAIKGSAISSFPGLMDTFHYVKGATEVIEKVRECWASVWSARAAFTRLAKGLEHNNAVIAPTVQLMVNSEVAGVLFTVNPVSKSRAEIVIEANWGLGETVVSGRCSSDYYVVRKLCQNYGLQTCSICPADCFTIREEKIANKTETCVQAPEGGRRWVQNPVERAKQATLDQGKLHQLCSASCAIEEHYGYPQDIEWAFANGTLYILQARRAKTGGK